MIQRKQTLFLLQLVFLGVAMLFIPNQIIYTKLKSTYVCLLPFNGFVSKTGHYAAVAVNFLGIAVSLITVFLYKKRELQVKLCYLIMALWLVLCGMIIFCPFIGKTDDVVEIKKTSFGFLCCAFALLAAYLATVFIKKDIELLKSADRIR